jgi:hypothetical protein
MLRRVGLWKVQEVSSAGANAITSRTSPVTRSVPSARLSVLGGVEACRKCLAPHIARRHIINKAPEGRRSESRTGQKTRRMRQPR